MEIAGIPFAADIMNFVILTAILSVGNSCLYASTRLLWSMANKGMAPKIFGRLSKRKVPMNALYFTMAFSLLSLLTSVMDADEVFILLMSIAGISVTISWIGIALSQFMFRRKYVREGGKVEDLKFKVPFHPFIPLTCIFFCLLIFAFQAYDPTQRIGLIVGIGVLVGLMLLYKFVLAKKNVDMNVDSEV